MSTSPVLTERVKGTLTQVEAEARAAAITGRLLYSIFYNFCKGDSYSGLVRVEFRLTSTAGIFMDFCGDSIDQLIINGTDVADLSTVRDGFKVKLDAALLTTERLNVVNIRFSNRYFTDGNGLMSYTDSEGAQFLYTQSEPFWGNRVVPLFDQPDLKAQFRLQAAAPADWKVITSVQETYITPWSEFAASDYGSGFYQLTRSKFTGVVPEGHNFWQFPLTMPLSTYLLNVVCGPYERIDLPVEERFRGIPMAIYCRASCMVAAKREAHNIFAFNWRGVAFYEKVFDIEYTFGKLDTIFCPDFAGGAMEYPGAVTYNETLLPMDTNTTAMVTLRGGVILHELAHMWFGNTVTMEWWNGLWLNESFADFVCYMAQQAITKDLDFPVYDAWLCFASRKGWGYKEDQELTTHNICAPVRDTEQADEIFDGITYSKGAATLRQLMAVVEEETFTRAMGVYFNNFKWSNTTLDDLLAIYREFLSEKKDQHKAYDMVFWEKTWLNTAGLNTVTPEWSTDSNTMVLRQGAALEQFPTLRAHRIDVAAYDAQGQVIELVEVLLDPSETTSVQFKDLSKAVAVLPNFNDFSFIKVILDEASSTFFEANLGTLASPLEKGLVLRSFYDAVRDARLAATDFIDSISKFLTVESNEQVIDLAYRYIGAATAILTKAIRKQYMSKLFAATKQVLMSAHQATEQNPPFIMSMIQKLISYSSEHGDVEQIKGWLEGSNQELGVFEHTNELRWSIVMKIVRQEKYSAEEKTTVFQKQWDQDTSDLKKKYKLQFDAIMADTEARKTLFNSYFASGEGGMNYQEIRSSCTGFNQSLLSDEEMRPFQQQFFQNIGEAMKTKSKTVAHSIFSSLFPRTDDTQWLRTQVAQLAEENKGTSEFLTKNLNQKLDELDRLIRCRALLPKEE